MHACMGVDDGVGVYHDVETSCVSWCKCVMVWKQCAYHGFGVYHDVETSCVLWYGNQLCIIVQSVQQFLVVRGTGKDCHRTMDEVDQRTKDLAKHVTLPKNYCNY